MACVIFLKAQKFGYPLTYDNLQWMHQKQLKIIIMLYVTTIAWVIFYFDFILECRFSLVGEDLNHSCEILILGFFVNLDFIG